MTKTEELLNNVAAILSQEYPEDSMMAYAFEMKARGLIEPIIAAAHAEGVAWGAEQERERILNPLVDKHWDSKVGELREGIVGDLTQLAFLGGKHPEMAWGELRHKYGNPVVDSFIVAVAVRERERIRGSSKYIENSNEENTVDLSFWHVPASVLAPTKEKPERGKPSQALLDELSEICGGKAEYEPSVLDPTKEGEK